jgi:hypothetical protein
VTTTVTAPPSPPPAPSLTLQKLERTGTTGTFKAGPIAASAGATVFYKLIVKNTGDVALQVTLADRRCDSGTLAPAGGVLVAPGALATFTCSHLLVRADVPLFLNTATATGTTVSPPVSAVSATANASVKVSVTLAATKTVRAAKVKKVTKKSKPAKPVLRSASFTG